MEFCLQTLVPRFFPQEWSPMPPLPIPPGLTPAHAAALACLLDACPQLIRSDAACQKLIHCYLRFHECAVRPLAPWVERIQDRSVVMSSLD